MKTIFTIVTVFSLIAVTSVSSLAYAHGGATHETKTEETAHSELTDTQMRTVIALLQKLVFLLTQKLEAQEAARKAVVPGIENALEHVEDAHAHDEGITEDTDTPEEMDVHHDEHAHDADSGSSSDTGANKLVIEVEAHFDKTHVHVRYTDKPEEMFFVEAPLTDESALVDDIHEHTGLAEDVVKEALKYLQ